MMGYSLHSVRDMDINCYAQFDDDPFPLLIMGKKGSRFVFLYDL